MGKKEKDNTESKRKSSGKEVAALRGEMAELKEKEKNLADAKHGQDNHLKYLEKQLEDTQQKLLKATADEKNYTWWMYGSRVYVWENDVKLAKQKVARYTELQATLEDRIEGLRNGT